VIAPHGARLAEVSDRGPDDTVINPTPPAASAATVAAVRAAASRLLGRSPALDQVAPALQRDLEWLAARGTPYPG
jgi:hypothetical protein